MRDARLPPPTSLEMMGTFLKEAMVT
ncbi:hypothetical protein E2C01_071320 [Portunus trituberculatus]|uniref:Uncharacterized protein n=1 Tax=Portunus trituberculatus TaxID=210409 RepID=A0A5B7I447_PORTR|nr:hypothetical protein [Portunus trituberculatus]